MSEHAYLSERESAILGQEFLTWLWFASERHGGKFKTAQGEWFEAYLEQRIQVEGGSGEGKEVASVSGAFAQMREARLGLSTGKKVTKAMLKLIQDGEEWSVTLKAEDFGLGSLKTPKVDTRREKGEDPDAVWLEKLYLIEKCVEFLDALYARFLELRLDKAKWSEELNDFRVWLSKPE